ncbi:PTPA-CTERM sorting domain-containing protein [Leptolyngbya sp. FACHB-36]|uniref:PTPA-CTERM sorting domain-containing protein n=1 Tax=Leptolyngbya sp. FACHB-36 TaxID=2692808 RepID=UPI001681529A|nr:PTPA-CTERM sorting domain-containing protein [Leptolyngbya sp. FACHB-36]MBD2021961.1 PTPA-CTERM sorting domain-containing protein [Leptolyngbya sp. FACHB-36]
MFNLKWILLPAATIAAAVTVSISTAAQAPILGGQATGIWQYDYDEEDGFSVGESFRADYTYNSDNITTTTSSSEFFSFYSYSSVPLLSLVLNSGPVSLTYDFSTPGNDYRLIWREFRQNPAYGQTKEKSRRIVAYDYSGENRFFAGTSLVQYDDGSLESTFFAEASSFDSSTSTYLAYGQTYTEVIFSDPSPVTAVPTPALLPGLVGLGLGILRKRKAQAASEQKV